MFYLHLCLFSVYVPRPVLVKKASGSLEQELQAVVSHSMWVKKEDNILRIQTHEPFTRNSVS